MLLPLLTFTLEQSKPVAVMIHGAGGGGWEYHYWRPVFEKAGFRVVAPDMMPSSHGLAETTFDDYVEQVVKAAGKSPDVLIGASMGGSLVLKAAETCKPKTLILVCTSIPAFPGRSSSTKEPSYPAVVKWANGPFQDTVDSMPDSDAATHRFAHPKWRDESGKVLESISKGVSVKKPAVPTLLIIPESDDTVPPSEQQALANWIGADTHRYAGMSHVGPLFSRRRGEVAAAAVKWATNRLAR